MSLKDIISKRRKGAVALLGVAAMVPVTAMFAASMNTGQMMEDRRQVQDAADALATVHATWTARSLNVITMNNVTATQLMTVAIGSEALEGTLREIEFVAGATLAYITAHGAYHCAPRNAADVVSFSPVCAAEHLYVSIPAQQAISGLSTFIPPPLNLRFWPTRGVADVRREFNPQHAVDVSHKAIAAVEGMNVALVKRFPQSMAEIGKDYTQDLGTDDFHFTDPCNGYGVEYCNVSGDRNGMALPLEEGGLPAQLEFCAAMGADLYFANMPVPPHFTTVRTRGFPLGKGAMSYGGSPQTRNVREFINDETKVGKILKRFKKFYKSKESSLMRHYTTYAQGGKAFDKHPKILNLPLEQKEKKSNSFNRRYLAKTATLCAGDPPMPDIADGIIGGIGDVVFPEADFESPFKDVPDNAKTAEMRLIEAQLEASKEAQRLAKEAADGILGSALEAMANALDLTIQTPHYTFWKLKDVDIDPNAIRTVQPDQMPDPFRILAYASKDKSKRLGAKLMPEDTTTHFGYAQTNVYNPDGASLYAENWRFRLMPASRMDDPGTAATELQNHATATFGPLASKLNGVGDVASWGVINAH